jgi:hypothetical protein
MAWLIRRISYMVTEELLGQIINGSSMDSSKMETCMDIFEKFIQTVTYGNKKDKMVTI